MKQEFKIGGVIKLNDYPTDDTIMRYEDLTLGKPYVIEFIYSDDDNICLLITNDVGDPCSIDSNKAVMCQPDTNLIRHKHHDEIVAWAAGHKIEVRNRDENVWILTEFPMWYLDMNYRIRVTPPPIVWYNELMVNNTVYGLAKGITHDDAMEQISNGSYALIKNSYFPDTKTSTSEIVWQRE